MEEKTGAAAASADADELSFGAEFDELYSVDADTESEGAWMDVPGKPGWRIFMRSQYSPKWRNFSIKQQKRHAALFGAGKAVPAEENDKDRVEQLAKVGILKWEGFNGLPCTPDNVRKVMTKYPPFRDTAMTWAAERSNFRRAVTEALEGN